MVMFRLLKGIFALFAFSILIGCGPSDKNITATSSGEEVYNQTCAACHAGGVKGFLTAAPEVGDKETWKPLIAKGVDALTAISINGVEKMPAKGSCAKCTDSQIKAAVEIMVANSQ